jgi:ATP-dependent RNA helicase DeaD
MLMKDGYNADSLHGDLTQQQRDRVMMKFRQRSLQILVATDVAARGIDVEDITHVIHLNIPDEMEFYTHRSGRTARAGKKGVSIAMISKKEVGKVKQIEKTLKTTFQRMMIPTGPEVCRKQLLALMHKVHEVKVNESEIAEFLPAIEEEMKDLSKQELIKRFASIEFNRFLDYYRNAADLNTDGKREGGEERYITGSRFFINLGKMDGLDVSKLIELIDDNAGIGKKDLGRIDLKGAYSFFEVEKEKADEIVKGLNGIEYRGRQVRVEITERKDSDSGYRSKGRSSGSGRDFKRKYSSGKSSGKSFGKSRSSGGAASGTSWRSPHHRRSAEGSFRFG